MTAPHARSNASTVPVQALRLGRTDYRAALELQRGLLAQRKAGDCYDLLLLTEHEPVLTLGRGADERFLRASRDSLEARGIALVRTERGGDITFHGPGQLVAYPILDLRQHGKDVHLYVRRLEETALHLLARYGIRGRRQPGKPGVWVGEQKIASVGVFISRWTTMHGIAINIAPDLAAFDLIYPCGLTDVRMTSVAELQGHAPTMEQAMDGFVEVFGGVFGVLVRQVDSIPAAASLLPAPTNDHRPARA